MYLNINLVIGILLVLLIIYIIYNKKQEVFTGNFPNLTAELETQLDQVVGSCFDEVQEPLLISTFLTKDMLTNPIIKEEIMLKLDELILFPLYTLSKLFRITIIDFKCGNSNGDSTLNNTVKYLLKVVKSITIVFREILDMSSDTPLPSLTFNDEVLLNQIACIRKKYLPYDDTKILNEYNLNNLEIDQTSSAYTFTTKLYEFILKLASNQPTEECLNVDMTQESNVLPSYTYFDGSQRTCNISTPSPSTTPSASPSPSTPLLTVPGYEANIFGTSYSNVTPAPNNLPRSINLINSQGPNNFFLPNIRIS